MQADGLYVLCTLLHRVQGRAVYVLTDEYDAPLNADCLRGYEQDMLGLMRHMLHSPLRYDALPCPVQVMKD